MPRPRKTEKEKKQDISIKADPSLVAEVEEIAFGLDVPISLIGRKLIARGLAAYKRDGRLDEPRGFTSTAELDIEIDKPKKQVKAKNN